MISLITVALIGSHFRPTIDLAHLRGMFQPSTRSTQQLIKEAQSGDQFSREDAINALGDLESPQTEVLSVLVDLLGDSDEMIRDFAIVALAKLGEPAIMALRPALEKNGESRISAQEVMKISNAPTANFILSNPGLLDVANVDKYGIRPTIRSQNDPLVVGLLKGAGETKDPNVRKFLLDLAINKTPRSSVVPLLVEKLCSTEEDKRMPYFLALDSLPEQDRKPLFAAAKTGRTDAIRLAALECLKPWEIAPLLHDADESLIHWIADSESLISNTGLDAESAMPLLRSANPLRHKIAANYFVPAEFNDGLEGQEAAFEEILSQPPNPLDGPMLLAVSRAKVKPSIVKKAFSAAIKINDFSSSELGWKLFELGESDPATLKAIGQQIITYLPKDPLPNFQDTHRFISLGQKVPSFAAALRTKLMAIEPEEGYIVNRWYVLAKLGFDTGDILNKAAERFGSFPDQEVLDLLPSLGEKAVSAALASIQRDEDHEMGWQADLFYRMKEKSPRASKALSDALDGKNAENRIVAALAYTRHGTINEKISRILHEAIDAGYLSFRPEELRPLGDKELPFLAQVIRKSSSPKNEEAIFSWIVTDLLRAAPNHPDYIDILCEAFKNTINNSLGRMNRLTLAECIAADGVKNKERFVGIAEKLIDQPEPAPIDLGKANNDRVRLPYIAPYLVVLEGFAGTNPKALSKLASLAKAGPTHRRILAIESLGRVTPASPNLKSTLESLLGDSEQRVRFAAGNSLLNVGYQVHDLDPAFGAVAIEYAVSMVDAFRTEILHNADPKVLQSTLLYDHPRLSTVPAPSRAEVYSSIALAGCKTVYDAKDVLLRLMGPPVNRPYELESGNANCIVSNMEGETLFFLTPNRFDNVLYGLEAIGRLSFRKIGSYSCQAAVISSVNPFNQELLARKRQFDNDTFMKRYSTPLTGQTIYGLVYSYQRLPGGRAVDIPATSSFRL